MKKIVNVGFATANEKVNPNGNDCVVKAPPSGSGSGSGGGSGDGSGSGGSGFDVVNASGTLSSSFGGRWEANGSFNLSVSYSLKGDAVTSIEVRVANVQVVCTGVPSGKQEKGCKYYAPVSRGLLLMSKDFPKREDANGVNLLFEINFPSQEFKTVITEYDMGMKETSETKTEYKSLTISLLLKCVFGSIKVQSCTIS